MSATLALAAILTLKDQLSAPLRAATAATEGIRRSMDGLQSSAARVSAALKGVAQSASSLGTTAAQLAAVGQIATGFGMESYIRATIGAEHRLAALGNTAGMSADELKEIGQIGHGYDHIIIDGPPRVTDLARSAIMAADVVLIPVQPSPYDIWAADEVVKLIDEARVYKENLKAVFVVNRKIANTAIGRDVGEVLAAYPVSALAASVLELVVAAIGADQRDRRRGTWLDAAHGTLQRADLFPQRVQHPRSAPMQSAMASFSWAWLAGSIIPPPTDWLFKDAQVCRIFAMITIITGRCPDTG